MKPQVTPTTPEEIAHAAVAELPPLIPLKQASELLAVSDRTIRRWASIGRLSVLRTTRARGGKVLIPRFQLERLLAQMVETNPFAA